MINAGDTFLPGDNRTPSPQINSGETRLPDKTDFVENAGETRLPTEMEMNGHASPPGMEYAPGMNVGGSYVVNRVLTTKGRQAQIYYVKKMGKDYVLKLYRDGWSPSERIQEFFRQEHHPNLTRVLDSGFFNGSYYEVYDYYVAGTLEEKKRCAVSYLNKVVIPSVNEGLHELHRNGIIHCDIKPGNIFCTEDDKSVAIGDFGLCEFTNDNGRFIDVVRGTPEYSPPVMTLYDTAAMSPAFDYGSFGLVLARLATGHSLLGGMSVEEIAIAWNRGVKVPTDIDSRLQILINGLIEKDERERWGYKEVKKWCEGEFIERRVRRTRASRLKKQHIEQLIFGHIGGETSAVSTLHQLAEAIRKNWNQARTVVRRRELTDFVMQFDADLAARVNKLSKVYDDDEAVFRLLYMLEDTEEIYFKGKVYSGVRDLLDSVERGDDPDGAGFMMSGLFVHYLRLRKIDERTVDKLEQLIKSSGTTDFVTIKAICYSVSGTKTLSLEDGNVANINEFVDYISTKTIAQIDELIDDETVTSWLYSMGFGNRINVMRGLR